MENNTVQYTVESKNQQGRYKQGLLFSFEIRLYETFFLLVNTRGIPENCRTQSSDELRPDAYEPRS